MEAIRYAAVEKKIEFCQVPIPKIANPNEVLIKIAYSGVCGTDLHIIQGEFPIIQDRPLILGHEFSGIVADIGKEVKTLRTGDYVVVDPNKSCNSCSFCHGGNPHFCENGNNIGSNKDGGWAEYVLIGEESVQKLPETMTLKQAALIEPLSCVSHGWDLICPVSVGMKILITGGGIIGTLWMCNLHLRGHKNVTLSEPNTTRLSSLEKLGTGYELITPDQLTRKRDCLFDVIIDCSGYAPAIEQAATLLERGGKLCMFGVAPPEAEIKLNLFQIFYKETKFFAVKINPFSFPKVIGLAEALGDRYLNYYNLGISEFQLEEYKDALEKLKLGTITKAVFKMS